MTETLWMNECYRHIFNDPEVTRGAEMNSLFAMPVRFSEHVPERSTKARWVPPAGDQFCEYAPEDEAWMRPLGLGSVVREDHGPCYFKVQEPSFPVTMPYMDFPMLREPMDDMMEAARLRIQNEVFRAFAVPPSMFFSTEALV